MHAWGDTCDVLLQNASETILESYPAIIPSGDITFSPAEVDRLVQYTRQGGTLLLNTAYLGQFPGWFGDGMAGQCFAAKNIVNGTLIVYGPAYKITTPFRAVMDALASQLLPVEVSGDVEYMINRLPTSWVVTLINNNGVTKTPRDAPVVDPAGAREVTVTYTGGVPAGFTSWLSDKTVAAATGTSGRSVTMNLPPGELEVIEISTT
jgi:hypothetical protein